MNVRTHTHIKNISSGLSKGPDPLVTAEQCGKSPVAHWSARELTVLPKCNIALACE